MSAPAVRLALAALQAVKAVGASAPHRKPKRRPPRRCVRLWGMPNSACREDLSSWRSSYPTHRDLAQGHGRRG